MGRPDEKNVGRSKKIPFIPGEDSKDRHARRFSLNLKEQKIIHEWAEIHGIILAIKNEGHHWIATLSPALIAEWWPSSAKVVFNKDWDHGIHCHDTGQFKALLIKYWGLKE